MLEIEKTQSPTHKTPTIDNSEKEKLIKPISAHDSPDVDQDINNQHNTDNSDNSYIGYISDMRNIGYGSNASEHTENMQHIESIHPSEQIKIYKELIEKPDYLHLKKEINHIFRQKNKKLILQFIPLLFIISATSFLLPIRPSGFFNYPPPPGFDIYDFYRLVELFLFMGSCAYIIYSNKKLEKKSEKTPSFININTYINKISLCTQTIKLATQIVKNNKNISKRKYKQHQELIQAINSSQIQFKDLEKIYLLNEEVEKIIKK